MKFTPLKEQVVVVFGASSGIGRASVLEFLNQGAKVTAVARDRTGIQSLLDEAHSLDKHDSLLAMTADCTITSEVKSVAKQTLAKWGKIDTWVQTAGIWLASAFENTTEEEFIRMFDTITLGTARAAWIALPILKKQGGSFIVVSSLEAKVSLPLNSAYSAAKHAVSGMLDSLRIELVHEKAPINVVNIMPGTVDTPLFEKSRIKLDGGELKWVGIPPAYKPKVVVDAIVYASTHSCRDIPVGTIPWLFLVLHKIAPTVTDCYLNKFTWKQSKTSQSKKKVDNLDKPIEGFDNIEGEIFGKKAFSFSLYNWIYNHQTAFKWGLGVGALVAATGTVIATKKE